MTLLFPNNYSLLHPARRNSQKNLAAKRVGKSVDIVPQLPSLPPRIWCAVGSSGEAGAEWKAQRYTFAL